MNADDRTREVLAVVAHSMLGDVSVIVGAAELLADDPDDDVRRNALELLERSAANLVARLDGFARGMAVA